MSRVMDFVTEHVARPGSPPPVLGPEPAGIPGGGAPARPSSGATDALVRFALSVGRGTR